MSLGWHSTYSVPPHGWTCGYCGMTVGGDTGFHSSDSAPYSKSIYICPKCHNPTAFIEQGGYVEQVPGAPYGVDVSDLPSDVASVYAEVRRCVQFTAYTAAVLTMRALLSHVAVDLGAEANRSFNYYVDYLDREHYITPNARDWVDELRRFGNEATHELRIMGESDAKRLLVFAEMLLRIVYEFPAKNAKY